MAERHSPLAEIAHLGAPNATLRLSHAAAAALVQVTSWPDTHATVAAAIGEVTGAAPAPLGRAARAGGTAVLSTGPGRYLISCPSQLAARLHRALPATQAAFTDIGHGRVVLRLEGLQAAEVLSKGAAIDFDLAVFPAGRVAATALHHIDSTIERIDEQSFELWVLRGFAESLAEWILDAGLEFGIAYDG